ncbi:amidohydrolase [Hutsoniella sourekii]
MKEQLARLQACRRHFHRFPEVAWQEYQTTIEIIEYLLDLGYQVEYGQAIHQEAMRMGVPHPSKPDRLLDLETPVDTQEIFAGYTGAVAKLATGRPGPRIGFRFDIDGLPVQETKDPQHRPNQEGFASQRPGYMHACGHDSHIAVGLALAAWLQEQVDQLVGDFILIFQPAEEGVKGGKSISATGLVDDCDYFFSGHIGMGLPGGVVGVASQGFLATSKLDIDFFGQGAHAGLAPEEGHNANLALATAVLGLHTLPQHSAGSSRINVGRIQGGSGRNVVADHSQLQLETRGSSNEINAYLEERVQAVVQGAALQFACDYQIHKVGEAPALAKYQGDFYRQVNGLLQEAHFQTLLEPDFGASEDVSFYMNRVSECGGLACHFTFGSDLTAGHHQSNFDIQEETMLTSLQVYQLLVQAIQTGRI